MHLFIFESDLQCALWHIGEMAKLGILRQVYLTHELGNTKIWEVHAVESNDFESRTHDLPHHIIQTNKMNLIEVGQSSICLRVKFHFSTMFRWHDTRGSIYYLVYLKDVSIMIVGCLDFKAQLTRRESHYSAI